MPAYLIANIEVTDPEGFERYRAAVPPVIAAHGGRYLVRGGAQTALEGALALKRLVILEFPSMAAAQAFYASPDYAPLLALRLATTRSDVVLVEGHAPG
ncbi:DUF1330 domain-containing protein [Falsiroseomonas oryziterrae]|uniref:DUF1330 domain-containing protein n=1 Tax=Falsiroseomonas oryziterrae TaxID=2911368 RepID=UPI001F27F56E|nr:DUF1330 domain-containing protein [Roseomonas sp. NPKOSM-4]